MDTVEEKVAAHYNSGVVLDGITDALTRVGVGVATTRASDLKPVDEFHTGGVEATEALLAQLTITRDTRVLDMGAGIGGTARLIAERYGASVVGVDLTEEYVATARRLSRMVGLETRTRFEQGSVTALPVASDGFDVALMLHVGMNVANKAAAFREAERVLAPGGVFAVFDVMRGVSAEPLAFPLPWAAQAETSFVAPPEAYELAATAAGFRLAARRDRTAFAMEFFAKLADRIAQDGPPALGIHLLMGADGREKIANYVANLKAGRLAPTEMIFQLG